MELNIMFIDMKTLTAGTITESNIKCNESLQSALSVYK